jgi:hypothetical protein
MYFILGAQIGRSLNSTLNDCSHGGSFAATEDSDSFDFQFILCNNNTGKSTFEFEDLKKETSVFSYVNVLNCRSSKAVSDEEYSVFVLTGSVLKVERGAIFDCAPTFLVSNGELTFVRVYTDLNRNVETREAKFTALKSYFEVGVIRTVKLQGLEAFDCLGNEEVKETIGKLRPEFELSGKEGNGIWIFLVITGICGVFLFCYSTLFGKYERYGRLPPV